MPPFRESPSVRFDAVANFRDLGGHTTRDGRRVSRGRLFRSGHLGHATDADVERLAKLGVRSVFDFRTLTDIESDGSDRLPDGTRHVRLPMRDPARHEDLRFILSRTEPDQMEAVFGNGKAAAMMENAAAGLVRERREPYRVFLSELADSDGLPGLFHCSAGKDRAGWAGSLVLLALGVDQPQVIEQYLLSNRNLDAIRRRVTTDREARRSGSLSWGRWLQPFLEVRREYIEASFEAMHADWGSFDRYLHEGLQITQAQRSGLREQLLE